MGLTHSEIEAKLAALEDRISLLFQTTDHLESLLAGRKMGERREAQLQAGLAALEERVAGLCSEVFRRCGGSLPGCTRRQP